MGEAESPMNIGVENKLRKLVEPAWVIEGALVVRYRLARYLSQVCVYSCRGQSVECTAYSAKYSTVY